MSISLQPMDPITGLSLGRIALGATAIAAPDLALKLFQLDGRANLQLPYMTRMFASREIALGTITLLAPRGARKSIVAMGMAVDGADAFAGYDAWQSGSVSRSTGTMLMIPAVGAVLAGALGILTERGPKEVPKALPKT